MYNIIYERIFKMSELTLKTHSTEQEHKKAKTPQFKTSKLIWLFDLHVQVPTKKYRQVFEKLINQQ